MLTEEIETVLISTSPEPTGHERIVVAFREGDDLYIPLDAGRAANDELLACETLYVRRPDEQDELGIYAVEGHRVISTLDRQRLEAYVRKPISMTTEVLHLSGSHVAVGQLHREPAGFVAVTDQSRRALRALGPARVLAKWYGRPLKVCFVGSKADAVEIAKRNSLDERDIIVVEKADAEGRLFEFMRQGHILVASAFGVWEADGQLHGMVNGLVKHNAPAVIGVGPKLAADWKPTDDQPVVIFVDDSPHAHDIVDQIDPLITPPRGPLMVVHITTEDPPNTLIAEQVAREINRRCGLPVAARNVEAPSVAVAVGTIASTLNAQLVILTSWHRTQPGMPAVSSTSVGAVAHASCPVVILSSP